MKKLIFIFSIFLLALTAQGQTYNFPLNEFHTLNGVDLVIDGGMEINPTSNWSTNNVTLAVETSIKQSGSQSLKVTDAGSGAAAYQTLTGLVVGNWYIFSAWGYNLTASIATSWALAVGESVGTSEMGQGTAQSGKDVWETFSLTFQATATTGYARLAVGGSSGSYIYFDGVAVRELNAFSQETQTGALGTAVNVYPTLDDKGSGRRWYEFDGVDSYLSIPNTTDLDFDTGDFTIDFMVYSDNYASGAGQTVCGKIESSTNRWNVDIQTDGTLIMFAREDGTTRINATTDANPFTDGQWHSVSISVTVGGAIVFYVDGSSVASTTATNTGASITNTGVYFIGKYVSAGAEFGGNISVNRIFKGKAFTSDEAVYYSIPSNPIKAADETACVLNLTASGLRSNQWYDELNEISATNNGAIAVIPSASNLGATQFTGEGATAALDSYIEIDDLVNDGTGAGTGPLSNTTQGTWMTEIWISDETPSINSNIMSFGDANANTYINLVILTNGSLYSDCGNAGSAQYTVITTAALSYGFYVVTLVQNGVNPVLYVDGVAVAQSPAGANQGAWFGSLTALDVGRIGCRNTNSGGNDLFFNGTISDARFWTTALSASEVLEESQKYRNR